MDRTELTIIQVDRSHSYISRGSDVFLQCKKHCTSYIGVDRPVGGLTISKDGDGIGQVGVKASE